VAGPLAELLAVTYGPTTVLGEVLASVSGVNEAYVYGSLAARYRGQGGDVPRDVDVLVVGDADDETCTTLCGARARAGGQHPQAERMERFRHGSFPGVRAVASLGTAGAGCMRCRARTGRSRSGGPRIRRTALKAARMSPTQALLSL
jgi:hypothetical protein